MSNPQMSIGSWAFSFGPFSDNPWPYSKVLRYAAETGYDGIELNGFPPHHHHSEYNTVEKCSQLKKEIDDLGLGISGYVADFTKVPPAIVEVPLPVEALVAETKVAAEAQLVVPFLRLGLPFGRLFGLFRGGLHGRTPRAVSLGRSSR